MDTHRVMASLRIIAGFLLLILGRQLFWLFVGVLGFVVGMDLAAQLIPAGQPTVLLVAVAAGILGAVLAYFFSHAAIAAAGFLAGGRIGVELAAGLALASPPAGWLVFMIAGLIGAVLLLLVFDWALIVMSSLLGASVIAQEIATQPSTNGILFIVLVLVVGGIALQAGIMRRSGS